MNIEVTFTIETALKNYTKLMMLSIRRERKLSFFVCNAIAQTIGRDSSDRSEKGNPPKGFSLSG